MATTPFTDDAYNKFLGGPHPGTLIGNWHEERNLRDASGEGRSIPQRHVKRSGLLKDFTKLPSEGPRQVDNTFERVRGPASDQKVEPASKAIGDFTEKQVNHVGPKEATLRQMRLEGAENDVQNEEAELAELDQERFFQSAYMLTHTKPDESQAQAAEHLRQGKTQELKYGPKPAKELALDNQGLEHDTFAHYSNAPEPTFHRMSMGTTTMRGDMKVSAAGGIHPFGKHSDFSKPVNDFTKGLAKDEVLDTMYKDLSSSQPLRTVGGTKPLVSAFSSVPSLADLKSLIADKIVTELGAQGYILLRQALFDVADFEGFVATTGVIALFREKLQLSTAEASDHILDCYLETLATMKKKAVRVSALMTSLRPVLPQKERLRALQVFQALEPVDGAVKLSSWLSKIQDEKLRAIIVRAFGFASESECTDMALTQQMFLEVVNDLAALGDTGALL
jgi:hypothetical protein